MHRILFTLFSLTMVHSALATHIVAIDLDATTPGIQSTLMVAPGTSIFVNVVAYDDGSYAPGPTPVMVDSVFLDVLSSAPVVASLAGGPATAGSFVAALVMALDAGTSFPTAPGTPLTPLLPASPPSLGLVGFFSLIGPGGAALLPVGMGAAIDLINLPAIIAGTPGSSILSIMGFPSGSELGFGGFPLLPTLASGTITVKSTTPPDPGMPEPGTLLLLGAGLAGLAARRRRKL